MIRLAILSAALLAGCATAPSGQILTSDVAQGMSAAELCLGVSTFRPHNAATAQAEIQRRGINCQDHAQAVYVLQQQRAQAAGILLQNATRPPPVYQVPAPPQQTNCTTRRIGETWRTVCN